MAQSDMFSPETNRFTSLEEVIDALKRMKDDPLADAGTNSCRQPREPECQAAYYWRSAGPRGKYQRETICWARRSNA